MIDELRYLDKQLTELERIAGLSALAEVEVSVTKTRPVPGLKFTFLWEAEGRARRKNVAISFVELERLQHIGLIALVMGRFHRI